MSQLSRPYQIALGAILVLGLVWIVAVRGHAANPNEPAPSSAPSAPTSAPTVASASTSVPAKSAPASSAPSTSAAAEEKAAAAPTKIYHGAAPGVEGLTRAIDKAHGAVAISQRKAAQFEHEHPSSESAAAADNGSTTTSHLPATAPSSSHKTASPSKNSSQAASGGHSVRQAQQIAVEQELAHGKTVVLMFWNPKSTVDVTVHTQVNALARRSHGGIAVHVALAGQVGTFGSVTEVAHVYQTPTVLIVNRHGVVSTLTGLTDVFALEQAMREAKSASA